MTTKLCRSLRSFTTTDLFLLWLTSFSYKLNVLVDQIFLNEPIRLADALPAFNIAFDFCHVISRNHSVPIVNDTYSHVARMCTNDCQPSLCCPCCLSELTIKVVDFVLCTNMDNPDTKVASFVLRMQKTPYFHKIYVSLPPPTAEFIVCIQRSLQICRKYCPHAARKITGIEHNGF